MDVYPALRPALARAALMMTAALVAARALALSAPAPAPDHYLCRAWQAAEGLPQNTVWAIAQTRDGYLWLGTEEGLARFDGVSFTVFDPSNTPALPGRIVRALVADPDGGLWAGTDGGLVRLREGVFTSVALGEGRAARTLRALLIDRRGRLWAGSDAGVHLLDGDRSWTFTSRDGLKGDAVRALHEDREGNVWIGTRDGGLTRWRDGRFDVYTTREGLPHDSVTALGEDQAGRLWVGTNGGGLVRREGERFLPPERSGGAGHSLRFVLSLRTDSAGRLWAGTRDGLVCLRDGRVDGAFGTQDGLSDPIVHSIMEDREGSLWIGTRAGGVNRLTAARFSLHGSSRGLSGDMALAVQEDSDGAVWVGTTRGLNRISGGTIAHVTTAQGLVSDVVLALHAGRRGDLWVGTLGGLHRLRDGRITRLLTRAGGLADDCVSAILEDRSGALWVGTLAGLHRLQDARVELFTPGDGLASRRVIALAERADGSLWVGTTDGGLSRFQSGRFTSFTTHDGLSSNAVQCLYDDGESLWIGTYGGGLNRLRDGRFSVYTTRDGLFSDAMHAILEDSDGTLWITSNNGVFSVRKSDIDAFDAGRLRSLPVFSLGSGDGMPELNGGIQPAGARGRDGRLWLPTIRGVAIVDPRRVRHEVPPVPVVLERVHAGGRDWPLRDGLHLPPGTTGLEVHYTGLSLVAPERILFRYRLEGLDEDWVEAGARRVASYPRLPPGHYRFTVAARNHDGTWTESPAALELSLAPRLHETLGFRAGLIMLAVAGAWLLHRFRLRLLEARAAVFEERARIAAEVHDGVAQGIAGIALQLDAASSAPDSEGTSRHHRLARSLTDQTLEELRRSLWALRPVPLDGRTLESAMAAVTEGLTAGIPTEAAFEVVGEPRALTPEAEAHLVRILQEALFNAMHHGHAGRVRVRLAYEEACVRLQVGDDGGGFDLRPPPAAPGRGFGVDGMRRRVRCLGGELQTSSKGGQGMLVTVTLPLRRRRLAGRLWPLLAWHRKLP